MKLRKKFILSSTDKVKWSRERKDGVEGRHPAKAGDAYYFRPNSTVGFYNQNKPGAKGPHSGGAITNPAA